MDGKCQHCHRPFPRRPHLPDQAFCHRKPCQNARKNQWRKRKLAADTAYRENQRDAQIRWQDKNPDYWRLYRASHPEYVETNRKKQRKRNLYRKSPEANASPVVAKSDASRAISSPISGYYMLCPVNADGIAKSDASFVKIYALSDTYDKAPGYLRDCKEMT
jgi:hypothetical protein